MIDDRRSDEERRKVSIGNQRFAPHRRRKLIKRRVLIYEEPVIDFDDGVNELWHEKEKP